MYSHTWGEGGEGRGCYRGMAGEMVKLWVPAEVKSIIAVVSTPYVSIFTLEACRTTPPLSDILHVAVLVTDKSTI